MIIRHSFVSSRHRTASTCLRCHEKRTARPESFPQIILVEHLEEMEGEPGSESCFDNGDCVETITCLWRSFAA